MGGIGPPPSDYWRLPTEDVLKALEVGEAGLSEDEAARRLHAAGPNLVDAEQRRHILADLARRLANPLVAILLIASAMAGAMGDMLSFGIIASMVLLANLLDMVQERRAQATAEALKRSIALRARVRRGGVVRDVDVAEIVPGDLVELRAGDLAPADGIVIEARSALVDQAALTGEPYPVAKRPGPTAGTDPGDAPGLILHGSSVIGGTLTIAVVATGSRTVFGGIAQALADEQPPTAFERGIHRLGILIVRLVVFLVLFVLLAHLALGRPPLESFLFAMALAVGLTPELLPMVVTVALAQGARRMAAAKVVVKRLSAIHDLGQMDVLCTDKTGTLTEARITMVAHPGIDGVDSERVLILAAVNARFETGLKSPLDEALLVHVAARSLEGWDKLDERPFDFERRRVSVLAEADGKRIEIVKGAPETVLALCDRAERGDGAVPLDRTLVSAIEAQIAARANDGLRMLAVAWKPAEGRERIDTDDDAGLVFAGLCVFVDPPKPEAAGAIGRLADAGVGIKIISGDAAPVVSHVAEAIGLRSRRMLTGEELARLTDDALAACVETVDLFARVTPDQKLRIVRALQARGRTVGFLGDGINDAPAIRAADVGISVEGATDVAREAADMILLAPDLNVLFDGAMEGRRTYANILKYIRMGTSSNFGNMLTMALASLVLPFLPLTAVQVLINNILYDVSQLGIPLDRADPHDMTRPEAWDMAGIVRFTFVMGPLSTLFDIATFALLLMVFEVDVPTFRAAWFMESMATQILVVFVIRTARPFWRDRPHPALVVSTIGCLTVALAIPFLPVAGPLGFSPPTGQVAVAIAGLCLIYLGLAEALKQMAIRPRRAGRQHGTIPAQ